MIFVTVGTQKFQFNRLLKEIDELVEQGLIEDVIAQIGNSDYIPKSYEFCRFMEKEEHINCIRECDLLITHCGVGTIVEGLKYKKPIIVYPRLKKFGEHVDDHQFEIAYSFGELNYVIVKDENESLTSQIEMALEHEFSMFYSNQKQIQSMINVYINKIFSV
ncbi:MAG: PssE/Cps14G family polysaccharide biosynthesis glycosyltransferase [Anaerocolumna sp.]